MSTAAVAPSRLAVLQLYRELRREGRKFSNYNFAQYVKRSTYERFHAAVGESSPVRLQELFAVGQSELQVVKRQVIVQNLFSRPSDVNVVLSHNSAGKGKKAVQSPVAAAAAEQ
jgi:hypothetical protein